VLEDGVLGDAPSTFELLPAMDAFLRSPQHRQPLAAGQTDLVTRNELSIETLTELCSKTPSVGERILKLAASPAYGSVVPIRSLEQAVLWLGMRPVSDLYLESVMHEFVFQAPGYEVLCGPIRYHSLAVAHIARQLTVRAKVKCESAFAAGILHEAALAVGVQAIAQVRGPADGGEIKLAPLLLAARSDLSNRLARAWKLPPDITIPILQLQRRASPRDTQSAVLCLADAVATKIGRGLTALGEPDPKFEVIGRAAEVLGLLPNQVDAIAFEVDKMLLEMG
jgi:HD-like signal output (HDOD) protein